MVVNGTINATINATVNATFEPTSAGYFLHYFPIIKERTLSLIMAPEANHDMLWIVFPLAVSVLFMTLYFGRYKHEELGWNTAFGNSLALLFVAVDLFRQVAKSPEHFDLAKQGIITSHLLVPSVILTFATILILSNFFHILPKFFAFFISSGLSINILAYVGIVVVYTGFPFDWMTLLSALVLFVMLILILNILKIFEPEDWAEKQQTMIDDMMSRREERKRR
ncbi:MAG: hypothetical protein ACE5DM_02690 [Candidatus Nanoarchaeia archaeon]